MLPERVCVCVWVCEGALAWHYSSFQSSSETERERERESEERGEGVLEKESVRRYLDFEEETALLKFNLL